MPLDYVNPWDELRDLKTKKRRLEDMQVPRIPPHMRPPDKPGGPWYDPYTQILHLKKQIAILESKIPRLSKD